MRIKQETRLRKSETAFQLEQNSMKKMKEKIKKINLSKFSSIREISVANFNVVENCCLFVCFKVDHSIDSSMMNNLNKNTINHSLISMR